ncbi:MAG: DUF3987 domain-containing protein [Victivallales bacterium]|nr:DUF3987 domain-containing protein [Victivallales bacterium]
MHEISSIENAEQFDKLLEKAREVTAKARAQVKDWSDDEEVNEIKKRYMIPVCWQAKEFTDGWRHAESAVPNMLFGFDNDDPNVDPEKLYKEAIKGREKALGIAYMEDSFRGKTRIVGIRPKGMSISEAQAGLGFQLGISYDPAPSSPASGFFLTGDTIYRDDELLFSEEAAGTATTPCATDDCSSSPRTSISGAPATTSDTDMSGVESFFCYEGIPIRNLVEEWERQHKGAPKQGDRNKYVYRIMQGFRSLPGFKEELLTIFIPRYGLKEAEFQATLKSALNSKPAMGIWKEMSSVLATFNAAPDGWWRVDPDLIENLEKKVMRNLPLGLKDTLEGTPKEEKMAVLLATLSIAGVYADQVRFRYWSSRSERQMTAFLVGIVAEAGGGKSAIRDQVQPWVEPLTQEAKKAREAIDAFKEARLTRGADEKLVKPKLPRRFCRGAGSNAGIYDCLKDAQGRCIFIQESEIDAVVANGSGAYYDWSTMLRHAFTWEEDGRNYVSDSSISYDGPVTLNMLSLGTPGAYRRLFGGENLENGLCQRFLLAFLPMGIRLYPADFAEYTPEQIANINKAIERLSSASGLLDMPKTNAAIKKWCIGKGLLALQYDDLVLNSFRIRAAINGARAAAVCHLLSSDHPETEKETKETVDMAILVAEYSLQNSLRLLGKMYDEKKKKEVTPEAPSSLSVWQKIFTQIPSVFTKQDILKIRPDMKIDSINRALERKVKAGTLEKVSDGLWHQIPTRPVI